MDVCIIVLFNLFKCPIIGTKLEKNENCDNFNNNKNVIIFLVK